MKTSDAETFALAFSRIGVTKTVEELLPLTTYQAAHVLAVERTNHQTEIVRSHHAFATPNR